MSDVQGPIEPDELDDAYRDAVQLLRDDADVQRRRHAVLSAVRAAADQADATTAPAGSAAIRAAVPTLPRADEAANASRWTWSANHWRGAAAACLVATCSLLALNLRHGADRPPVPNAKMAELPPIAAADRAEAVRSAETRAAPDLVVASAGTARAPTPGLAAAPPVADRPPSLSIPAPTRADAPERVQPSAGNFALAPPAAKEDPGPGPVSLSAAAPTADSARRSRQPSDATVAAPADTAPVAAAAATVPVPAPAVADAKAAAGAVSAESAAPPVFALKRLAGRAAGGLIAAVLAGDSERLVRLLEQVPPDAERDAEGRTALALAVSRSDVRCVAALLARGADRLAADRAGRTPLDEARATTDPAVRAAFGLP
jgi:hypothetical protein